MARGRLLAIAPAGIVPERDADLVDPAAAVVDFESDVDVALVDIKTDCHRPIMVAMAAPSVGPDLGSIKFRGLGHGAQFVAGEIEG